MLLDYGPGSLLLKGQYLGAESWQEGIRFIQGLVIMKRWRSSASKLHLMAQMDKRILLGGKGEGKKG
jgi:hypothetical protein